MVKGITIIRNGEKYGYPYLEAIESVLPLVDEMIVGVGDSEDETRKKVEELQAKHQKIKIIDTVWDFSNKGGTVLSVETNRVLDQARDASWCIYVQGDECFHDEDFPLIKEAMKKAESNDSVDALALSYRHFYGNFDTLMVNRRAYRYEVRVFKPRPGLKSWGDAQGFRFEDGKKPNAIRIPARVFHYGWVRPIETMKSKAKDFDKMFHEEGSESLEKLSAHWDQFDFQWQPGLIRYRDTHPTFVRQRIQSQNYPIDWSKLRQRAPVKDRIRAIWVGLEAALPFRLGEFKNYKPI